MPSKRKSISEVKNYYTLILDEVLCPICRSIMIDPVSLPCNHNFCLCCFDDTMKSADLVCPLCHLRVGSWWRKAQIEGKHINRHLQTAINVRFARQVSNKLNGIDENWKAPNIVEAHPKQECEVLSNGGEEEFKDEASEHSASIKEEKRPLEIHEEATASSSGMSASQLESSEDARSDIEKPANQSNDFAAKRFTCVIFPLDTEESEGRETIFSPIGVTAEKIKAERQLKQLKAHKDYCRDVQAEKVRLLEQYEQRLASGNLFTWPPPKPIIEHPSHMEIYLKQNGTPVEVQYPEPKIIDFATKEYTCRELILKKDNEPPSVPFYRGFVPSIIRPNIPFTLRKSVTSSNSIKNSRTGQKKKLSSKERSRINISQKNTHKMTTSRVRFAAPSCSSTPEEATSPRSRSPDSPEPFCGFHPSDEADRPLLGFEPSGAPKHAPDGSHLHQRALQERLDLEFAIGLQKSLDRAHFTRRPFRV